MTVVDAAKEWLPMVVLWGGVALGGFLAFTGHVILGGVVVVGALALGWLWDSRSVFI